MEPRWDKLRVQPEIARRRLILDPRVTQFWLGVACIAGGTAIIVVSAGAFARHCRCRRRRRGNDQRRDGPLVPPASSPPSLCRPPWRRRSWEPPRSPRPREAISVATYNAMLGSATVKAVAATAGVLLLVGSTNSAQASTGRVEIDSVIAFRAVPVNDFTDRSGTLYADSNSTIVDNMYSDQEINDKFSVGTKGVRQQPASLDFRAIGGEVRGRSLVRQRTTIFQRLPKVQDYCVIIR